MKRRLWSAIRFFAVWFFQKPAILLLTGILRFYESLWDEDAAHEPNNYLHQKVIWELRAAIKTISQPL